MKYKFTAEGFRDGKGLVPTPIKRKLLALRRENKLLRKRLKRCLLSELMRKEELPQRTWKEFLRLTGEMFPTQWFILINVYPENKELNIDDGHNESVRGILERAMAEAVGSWARPEFFDRDEFLGCLAALYPEAAAEAEKSKAAFEQKLAVELQCAVRYCRNEHGLDISIAVSSLYDNLSRPKMLCREAITAHDHRKLLHLDVTFYRAIAGETAHRTHTADALSLERRFFNAVIAHDFPEALKLLNTLMDIDIHRVHRPLIDTQEALFTRMQMIFAILELDTLPDGVHANSFGKALQALLDADGFSSMRDAVTKIFDMLSDYFSNTQDAAAKRVRQINDIIADRCADSQFGFSSVCKEMKLSRSYLSRFYKEQTGRNLLNAIQEERIKKAKRLIETSGLPLYQIASDVGFNSYKTMARLFEKLEGLTPQAYRASLL